MAKTPIPLAFALVLAAAVWSPHAAVAAEAALIVAVQGQVSPPAEDFSEAEEGAVYSLGDDAEIIVMHYAACLESHFKGGQVSIGALGASSTGQVVSETTVECPRKVAFAEDANTVAAVVLRGGEDRTLINARPVFVLLADGVERIDIRRDGAAVGMLTIDGRLARWPSAADPLTPGADYEIALQRKGVTRTAAAAVAADAGVTVVQP